MNRIASTLLLLPLTLRAQTAPPAAAPTGNAPAVLPGRGLAQHDFLYCGEWNYDQPQQTMWVIRDGKPVWSYDIPFNVIFNNKKDIEELGDCTQRSNGNIVFSTRLGAAEVTPDKKIVWQMFTPIGTELHSIQAIGLDHVLVAENGNPSAKLLLIDTVTNKIEKEVPIPVGHPDKIHPQIRRARMLPSGNFLVAHMDWHKVAEYDGAGKEAWSCDTPQPWAAVRLANGNTLVTGNSAGYVRELNPKCEVVWSFERSDMPDYTINCIQDVVRLPNGNTVFSAWIANKLKPEEWPTSVQLFEVTPDKKIVWALRQWSGPDLGPASGIQILDAR